MGAERATPRIGQPSGRKRPLLRVAFGAWKGSCGDPPSRAFRSGWDLNLLVESMGKMLQRLIGENIHLELRPAAGLWTVLADPNPRMKVLYISGYMEDEEARENIQAAGAAFLQKPFTP